jgi:hypothetical protein
MPFLLTVHDSSFKYFKYIVLFVIVMSFGYSVGDFVLLVQLAHKAFRNCQQAGDEYLEIASEVRCLHSVLRILRAEAESPESKIFRQDPSSIAQLIETADGCRNVLASLDALLMKYDGLNLDSKAGTGKKLRHRLGFGSKIAELGVIRGKLITYTSTISVLIDTMQLQGTKRIETKVEGGFADVKVELKTQFDLLRKEIYSIASQKRADERMGATFSTLSLSTYAGDEKNVWRDFRKELISKGFRSDSLERHKDVLQSYMMKLDQSGILDREHITLESNPWLTKQMYLQTIDSLADPRSPDPATIAKMSKARLKENRRKNSIISDSNHDILVTAPKALQEIRVSHAGPTTEKAPKLTSVQADELGEAATATPSTQSTHDMQPTVDIAPEVEAVSQACETELHPSGKSPTRITVPKANRRRTKRPQFTTPISIHWMQSSQRLNVAGVLYGTTRGSETPGSTDTPPPRPSVNDEDQESAYEIDVNGELRKIQYHVPASDTNPESTSTSETVPQQIPNLSIHLSYTPVDANFRDDEYQEVQSRVRSSTPKTLLTAGSSSSIKQPRYHKPAMRTSYVPNSVLDEFAVEHAGTQPSFEPSPWTFSLV